MIDPPADDEELYSFDTVEEAYRAGFDHGCIAARAKVRDSPENTVVEGFFDWMQREGIRPAGETPSAPHHHTGRPDEVQARRPGAKREDWPDERSSR